MHDEPNNQSQAALLERRVGELDDRLRTIEAWSVEMYQYQSFIRPRTAPYPPAPRSQPQPITSPSVQPVTPPSTPYTTPVFTGPFPAPPQQPFPATPPPSRQPPPLWQPVANLYNQLRATPETVPATATTAPAGPPPGQPAPATAAIPSRRWSLNELEQLLSGRGLAWVGGLAILLGAIFFLGLAFTRGWIGPAGRVGIGLIAGGALIAAGAWFFERREALFVEPKFSNYARVDLERTGLASAEETPPPTSVRETLPAPAPAPRVRLSAPTPLGIDGARRSSGDPAALSADLIPPAYARGVEEVVGPPIPTIAEPVPRFVESRSGWRGSMAAGLER